MTSDPNGGKQRTAEREFTLEERTDIVLALSRALSERRKVLRGNEPGSTAGRSGNLRADRLRSESEEA